LAESTALSSKSEREYLTLRDSMKGMVESWKRDTDRLRDEINKREAKHKAEAEKIGKDYKQLMQEMKKAEKGKEDLKKLKEENEVKNVEVEKMWTDEIAKMRLDLEKSHEESEKAVKTAQVLEEELARLRRMMRTAGREAAEKEREAAQSNAPP
jgi:Mg2+ and Co2+ transporter CorA